MNSRRSKRGNREKLKMGKSGHRRFDFQQFTILDDRCAMKVGTDAVLLGAWCDVQSCRMILDIGTGSGIIALMLAQRAPNAHVVGVELEPQAASQAKENMANSPFVDRIEAIQGRIQDFALSSQNQRRFDAVVANPPFFSGKPKSPDFARNLARHDDHLNLADLVESGLKCLSDDGELYLVWPMDRYGELMHYMEGRQLCLEKYVEVKGSPVHASIRFLSSWKRSNSSSSRGEVEREELIIESETRPQGQPQLTEAYYALISPYLKSNQSSA